MKRRIFALVLAASLLLGGCQSAGPRGGSGHSVDLMAAVQPRAVQVPALDETAAAALSTLGVQLLQNGESGENVLISPLSILYALAMTANGVKGDTLDQMEAVLGLPRDALNNFARAYQDSLAEDETLKLANAIWFKDVEGFTPEPDFLQTNADYYGAGLFQAPFDASTCNDINEWVKEHTGGLIEKLLDEIPEDAVMYLINALSFDAEWANIYEESQIQDGVFTTEDGQTRDVELMHSREYVFLQDSLATGFLKYYAGRRYAFAALLPNEGVSVSDYCASLTGEGLQDLLTSAETGATVYAAIPKFEAEYSTELSDALGALGMTDAFDPEVSDFSALGQSQIGKLYISRVLHKTRLVLDERGTRAGAVTAVEVVAEGAMLEPEEIHEVTLDRPFLYLLLDCETNTPLFIGVMMDPK